MNDVVAATPRALSEPASLQVRLRAALSGAGDPERARGQQAYMKSDMPYYGVTTPELRRLLRPLLAEFRPSSREQWEQTVRTLWDGAERREERYAAIAFAQHRSGSGWQDPETLRLYRHLVATGAWWDLVDGVAADLIGGVLRSHRRPTTPILRDWAVDDDLWVRRAAVLSQLKHGAETDLDLLSYAIEANADDASFWLRKAIGWALRQYARTDPEWVREEVARLGPRLSGLSRREALKHLA